MTDKEKRITIFEALGWKYVPPVPKKNHFIVCHENLPRWKKGKEWAFTPDIPEYTTDLNAMHEAEKSLTGYNATTGDSQYGRYISHLQQITNWNRVPCATAAQRTDAFIATITPKTK